MAFLCKKTSPRLQNVPTYCGKNRAYLSEMLPPEILWKIKGFVAILRQDMSGGIFVFLLGER